MTTTADRRVCNLVGCNKLIPPEKRSDAKYCTKEHQRRAASRRKTRKRIVKQAVQAGNEPSGMQGPPEVERLIVRLEDEGVKDLVLQGNWTQAEAARFLEVSQKDMSIAMRLIRDRLTISQSAWAQSDRIKRQLMLNPDGSLNDYTGSRDDIEAALKWATEAADNFLQWEAEFFSLGAGKPWIRKEFHRVWIIEAMLAYATGGYLQILSPPRHGKSELMVHLAVWIICRNPDIRMLWVGAAGDKGPAGDMVSSVGQQLEKNEKLRLAVLGPGNYWKPKRSSGTRWSRSEIVVDNRTTVLTGATLLAVGRGSKILSRNADVIFCDDIEDFDSTRQPGIRRETRRWFGITLDSRKEEHTPMIVIGSRQHPDDLYGYNLENSNFRCVVNAAHDPNCVLDEEDLSLHVDCMLFPELRTYRWLMTKKEGASSRQEASTYDLVYLNDPQAEGITVFVKEEVEASRNFGRVLGLEGIPEKDRTLIGGLDPSATGFQAGFLWALTPVPGRSAQTILDAQDFLLQRWMVDIDNRRGGGSRNALDLIKRWYDMYGLRHWVIEESGAWAGEGSFRRDPEVRRYCQANDIKLEGLQTSGTNKYDPVYGVAAQSHLFRDGLIDLPYGDERSRTKTKAFIRQVLRFTEDATLQKKRRSDIHMASWLPTKAIRRREKQELAELSDQVALINVDSDYPFSYSELDSFTDLNTVPWS